MAGVMALINQKAGSPQGNPNAELYTLASKQTYASCKSETGTTSNGCYFNDVDTGTIAMACAPATPNCTVSQSGDAFGILSGYSGTVGFDLATGLGSLNVANVVNGWTAATGTATATVTIVPGSSTIVSNVPLTVTGTVTGSSGTPTGTVTLTGGGYTSSATSLVSGAYTITIPANKLSAGSDTLTATYSGDATYASATKTAVVTVTAPVLLTPTVTVSPAASSIAAGQGLNVVVTVTGTGATPTGTVVLTQRQLCFCNQNSCRWDLYVRSSWQHSGSGHRPHHRDIQWRYCIRDGNGHEQRDRDRIDIHIGCLTASSRYRQGWFGQFDGHSNLFHLLHRNRNTDLRIDHEPRGSG